MQFIVDLSADIFFDRVHNIYYCLILLSYQRHNVKVAIYQFL